MSTPSKPPTQEPATELLVWVFAESITLGHQLRRSLSQVTGVQVSVYSLESDLGMLSHARCDAVLLAINSKHWLNSLTRLLPSLALGDQLLLIRPDDGPDLVDLDVLPLGSTAPVFRWPTQQSEISAAVSAFSPTANTASNPTPQLTPEQLATAIAEGRVQPFFQPKVSIPDGELLGFEALARLRDPDGSWVFPDRFISVAEEHGLITRLTRAMILAVLEHMGEWQIRGMRFQVSFNATTADLEEPDFATWLISQSEQAGVPSDHLVLELTESRLTKDPTQLLASLTHLRQSGFGVAIDDFGTGYSSLEQLQRVPATELKIDRAFVHGARADSEKAVMLEHSIGIGRNLNLKVVAEGIEDESDWTIVSELGGQVCQGWFTGKPMPASEIDQWQADWQTRQASLPKPPRPAAPFSLGKIGLVGLIALVIGLGFLFTRENSPTATESTALAMVSPRLAIIPLSDALPEDRTYLVNGFAEALANELSGAKGLTVIAPTSVSIALQQSADSDLATQLDASLLLEVSMRGTGALQKLTLRLIEPVARTVRWSTEVPLGSADGQSLLLGDVRTASRKLQSYFGLPELLAENPLQTIDPRAYQSFLKGLEAIYVGITDDTSLPRALRHLRYATEIQPDFADAWALLASLQVGNFGSPIARDYQAFVEDTEYALETALMLSPRHPIANAAAATWYSTVRQDLESAQRYLAIAEESAPGARQSQYAAIIYSMVTGNTDAALVGLDQLIAADPLNMSLQGVNALYQGSLGLFDEAFAFLEPCHLDACLAGGYVYFSAAIASFSNDPSRRALWADRLATFQDFIDTLPDNAVPALARLNRAFATLWFDDPADEAAIAAIRRTFDQELIVEYIGVTGPTLATVLDEDTFFATLERAVETGHMFYGPLAMAPFHGTNPYPDWVLEHPRYRALWESPKMRGIAELLAARNLTAGLPQSPRLSKE